MRLKKDGTPHAYQFRVTHKGSVQYVIGQSKAKALPGKKETITYRMHVWVPNEVDGEVVLVRKSVYGSTPSLCEAKAEALRKAAPFILDVAQSTVGVKVNPQQLKHAAEVLDRFETGEWSIESMVARARAAAAPTIRALAEESIRHKEAKQKNTVSDRSHLAKLSLPYVLDGRKVTLGSMMASEVTQRHLVEWVKVVAALPGRKEGDTLSEHSVELAVAMVKSAWQQLSLVDHAHLKDRLKFDDDLGLIFRKGERRAPSDKRPIPLETIRAVCNLKGLADFERAMFGLQMAGMRPNEIGAIRPTDMVLDEHGRIWVEPLGAVTATRRKWKDLTKTGARDNRSIPLPPFLVEFIGGFKGRTYLADDGSGKPLDTKCVRNTFRDLVKRAGCELGSGQDSNTMRHTVITEVTRVAGFTVAEAYQHAKLPNSMVGRHYTLMEIRELRKLGRTALMVNGRPVCDLLPWATWCVDYS